MSMGKCLRIVLFIVLFAAVPAALPQSTTEVRPQKTVMDIMRQLLPGYQARLQQINPQTTSATQDALKMGLVVAKIYKYSTADYPGAAGSIVFDSNGTASVGAFQFNPSATPETAFTLTSGVYRTLLVPGSAMGSIATGINGTGAIVGTYMDATGVSHGFLDIAGVFSTVDVPSSTGTEVFDINSGGVMVGAFTDAANVTHGFVDNGGIFTGFDYPGATSTIAAGINFSGEIVGQWEDASFHDHGFIYNSGTFTDLDFPLSVDTTAIGVNDGGEIAGYYTNTSGPLQGFLYSDGTFTTVNVAGATGTELARIKNTGQVVAEFIDALNETHGAIGH